MTDKLEADRNRGARAERLLADEVLTSAFATLEADYILAWKSTPARDTDARERLWQAVQVVGKVKTHLQSVAASGKLAAKEIDALAGPERKRFGIV